MTVSTASPPDSKPTYPALSKFAHCHLLLRVQLRCRAVYHLALRVQRDVRQQTQLLAARRGQHRIVLEDLTGKVEMLAMDVLVLDGSSGCRKILQPFDLQTSSVTETQHRRPQSFLSMTMTASNCCFSVEVCCSAPVHLAFPRINSLVSQNCFSCRLISSLYITPALHIQHAIFFDRYIS